MTQQAKTPAEWDASVVNKSTHSINGRLDKPKEIHFICYLWSEPKSQLNANMYPDTFIHTMQVTYIQYSMGMYARCSLKQLMTGWNPPAPFTLNHCLQLGDFQGLSRIFRGGLFLQPHKTTLRPLPSTNHYCLAVLPSLNKDGESVLWKVNTP